MLNVGTRYADLHAACSAGGTLQCPFAELMNFVVVVVLAGMVLQNVECLCVGIPGQIFGGMKTGHWQVVG